MIVYLQMIDTPEDRSKFEQLYLEYRGLMFHAANQILHNEQDAEDAVHQAFLTSPFLPKPGATLSPSPKTKPSTSTAAGKSTPPWNCRRDLPGSRSLMMEKTFWRPAS